MPEKKLANRLREAIRLRGYSYRTEKAYVHWYERYVRFHKLRHPATMGAPEACPACASAAGTGEPAEGIKAFLTHLVTEGQVSASTQTPCTEPVEVKPSPRSCSSTSKSSASPSATCMPSAPRKTPTSSPTSVMTNACASSPNLTPCLTSSPASSTVVACGCSKPPNVWRYRQRGGTWTPRRKGTLPGRR